MERHEGINLSYGLKEANLSNKRSRTSTNSALSSITTQRRKSFDCITRKQTEFLRKQSKILPPISEARNASVKNFFSTPIIPAYKKEYNNPGNSGTLSLPSISSSQQTETTSSHAEKYWSYVFAALELSPVIRKGTPTTMSKIKKCSTNVRAQYYWKLIRDNLRYLVHIMKKNVDEAPKDMRKLRYLRHIAQKMSQLDQIMQPDALRRRAKSEYCLPSNFWRGSTPNHNSRKARYHWGLIRKRLSFLVHKMTQERRKESLAIQFQELRNCRYLRLSAHQIADMERMYEEGAKNSNCLCSSCSTLKYWRSVTKENGRNKSGHKRYCGTLLTKRRTHTL